MPCRWDVIEEGDLVILNASWPQDRGVFWVQDPHPYATDRCAFVLDDCADDAAESMASHNDHEGDDGAITVREATIKERVRVMAHVRAFLVALEKS